MSTGEAFSFYKFGGEVDQSALAPLVSTQKHQEVIGWFKFRRETPLRPSLREAAIHSSLHSTLHSPLFTNLHFIVFWESLERHSFSLCSAVRLTMLSRILTIVYSIRRLLQPGQFYVTLILKYSRLQPIPPQVTNLVSCALQEYSDFNSATSLM